MPNFVSYRTCRPAALLLFAAFFLAGCGAPQKKQETMNKQMNDQWNATRAAVMLQLATQQYEVGDYDKCRQTLSQAFTINYPMAKLHTLAAKVELEKGSLEVADTQLKMAVRIDPSDPEPYYLLGVLYQRWQNIPAAHDYYVQAWNRKPSEALYLLAVVEMKITLGHYDEAQKLLESKIVFFEQSAAVRAALAKIYSLKGRYDDACKLYREATILSPDDADLRRDLAEAYFFAGRYADALPVLEHLVSATTDSDPDPDVQKSDNEVALDDPDLRLMLARTYIALHRLPDARNVLFDIVQSDSHNNLAWLTLGQASLEMGDLSEAGVAAHRILHDDSENLEALILLATVQEKARAWSQAQETLLHAARVAPEDPTVLCMQGLNLQSQGDAVQAAAFYSKALAAKPGDSWAEDLLASTGVKTLPAAPKAQDQDSPAQDSQSKAPEPSPASEIGG